MIALRQLRQALAPALWTEMLVNRTRTARVWQHSLEPQRFYCVVRQSPHCFASPGSPYLDQVIDYRLRWTQRGWVPHASPFRVRMARKGEHVEIAGVELELLDFGMERAGIWWPLLPISSERLAITPRCAPYRLAATWHASYFDGALAPGVKFHASISAKGYGKELRFSPLVQQTYFHALSDAQFFGFRYRMRGELDGDWTMRTPRMYVHYRGGHATGFYRRDGEWLYVLFARKELDRLLPGEWIVDPAITQESVAANSDDCYEANGTNNLNGYNGRFYAGRYASPATDFHAGMRFQTIPIPADATGVNSSTIQVFREILNGTPNLTIFGDDQDDAPTFAAGTGAERPNGAGVTRTTASVNWTSGFGAANNQYVTLPSVQPITEEIILRPGWANNADIRFVVINNATTGLNDIGMNDFNNNSTTEEALFDADYVAASGEDPYLKRQHRRLYLRRSA